jgi:hypothetical protein
MRPVKPAQGPLRVLANAIPASKHASDSVRAVDASHLRSSQKEPIRLTQLARLLERVASGEEGVEPLRGVGHGAARRRGCHALRA